MNESGKSPESWEESEVAESPDAMEPTESSEQPAKSLRGWWIALGVVLGVLLLVVVIVSVKIANTPRDRTYERPADLGEDNLIEVPKYSKTFTVPFTIEEEDVYRIWVEAGPGGQGAFEVRDADGEVVTEATSAPTEIGGQQAMVELQDALGFARLAPGEYELVQRNSERKYDTVNNFHIDAEHAETIEPGDPFAPHMDDFTWVGVIEVPEDASGITIAATGVGLVGQGYHVVLTDSTGKAWETEVSTSSSNAFKLEDMAPGELIIAVNNPAVNPTEPSMIVELY